VSEGSPIDGFGSPDLQEAEQTLLRLADVFSPALRAAAVGESNIESIESPDLDARYRALVEQIPAVVFLAFLDKDLSEAYVSPQIENLLGFSPGEWLHDPVRWYSQIHPDDKERWSIEAAGMLLTGQPVRSVYRALARNGRVVWFHCEVKMVRRDDGRPWFMHGVAFDVTDQKEAEAALRRAHDQLEMRVAERTGELALANEELQAEVMERKRAEAERAALLLREQEARREAEQANRLKDEFLATVSHELRTPLVAIVGWSQMLRGNHVDPAEAEHALEVIERSAKVQAQLIDDLLDISRIISGKLRLDVTPIDPANSIRAAIDVVQPAALAKNIELVALLDANVGQIRADADRLQQVVWNLLSNAIKFTPAGGRVSIRLQRIESQIQIVVSDTGAGISSEFLPFVFDRFRQADGSSNRTWGGLGLGLAIVRHVTELHGGTVTAESAGEGQGATFTVKLPAAAASRG
jgi:PAS domain S-box-containing protein